MEQQKNNTCPANVTCKDGVCYLNPDTEDNTDDHEQDLNNAFKQILGSVQDAMKTVHFEKPDNEDDSDSDIEPTQKTQKYWDVFKTVAESHLTFLKAFRDLIDLEED